MQVAGSSSWRFEEDNAQYLHVALFTRDAAGPSVPPSADVPPQLASGPSGSAGILSADERRAAAAQWVTWWRRLLAHVAREARLRQDMARTASTASRVDSSRSGHR